MGCSVSKPGTVGDGTAAPAQDVHKPRDGKLDSAESGSVAIYATTDR